MNFTSLFISRISLNILEFVNDNVAKKKYQMSHKVYRETMTAMCATLRNPKPKAEDIKKILNIKREQEVKQDESIDREKATESEKQDNFEDELEELSDGDFDKEIEENEKEKRKTHPPKTLQNNEDKKVDRAKNSKRTLDLPKQCSQKKNALNSYLLKTSVLRYQCTLINYFD